MTSSDYKCPKCGADRLISSTFRFECNSFINRITDELHVSKECLHQQLAQVQKDYERVVGKFDACRASLGRVVEKLGGNPHDTVDEELGDSLEWHEDLIQQLEGDNGLIAARENAEIENYRLKEGMAAILSLLDYPDHLDRRLRKYRLSERVDIAWNIAGCGKGWTDHKMIAEITKEWREKHAAETKGVKP